MFLGVEYEKKVKRFKLLLSCVNSNCIDEFINKCLYYVLHRDICEIELFNIMNNILPDFKIKFDQFKRRNCGQIPKFLKKIIVDRLVELNFLFNNE